METISTLPSALEAVRTLYDRGLYLQAHSAGAALGPLQEWPGSDGQTLAGRLAGNLGASRFGAAIHFRTWRKDRTHPEACLYYVFAVCTRRGPLPAWNAHCACAALEDAAAEVRADWHALRGRLAAMLRDFDTADRWMDQALQLCNDRPWPWVERATILQMQDRYAQALESAEQALRLHPFYRPAVQSAAQLLQLLNRDREALELLQDASQQLESGDIVAQLAALQSELEMYPEARESWQRADSLLVLKDKTYRSFSAARRSDAAYHCGDEAECLHWAKEADAPFFKAIAEHLKLAPPDAKRVRLSVGFVRQHHMTCALATLSAISSFWQMPANHLDVAEKICYDGTPSHSQRRWAEQNGYLAREFKLTWDAAVTLIDRGVPFTLTTVEPGNAHLQAIVGYDARRGTLLIRDPTFRTSGEALAKELLARYASTGPRAMVLVPHVMSHLVEAVDLPEEALYDRLFRLEISLQGNDRKTAAIELECLQAAGPEHRLAVLGRQILANYDRNLLAILAATEAHLKQFPSDVNAQLAQLSLLTQLSRRPDRLQRLHDLCTAPQADPILWLHEVRETIEDGRQHAALRGRLRKIIRFRPQMAGSYHELARIEWARQRRDTAVELFRFAACLDDKDERHAHSFFVSMRNVGRAAEALQMLQGRFKRFGLQSSQPARTLCWGAGGTRPKPRSPPGHRQGPDMAARGRSVSALCCRFHCSQRQHRKSHELVASRRAVRAGMHGGSKLPPWRPIEATLRRPAIRISAIVAEDPLAVDAQRTYTRLLADIYGLTKALEHLREVVKQFPYHYLFNQMLVEWLREFDPPAVLDALGPMLDSFASDAWTRRELAIAYTRCLNGAAALREAEAAKDLEPSSSWSWSTLGYVHAQSGRIKEAREALRQSITLSVDNESAIAQLLDLSSTAAERLETIVFVYEELCKQVTLGEGLLAWREKAAGILDGITMLHVLLEALQARPDLWQTWSALVQQLTVLSHFERASEVAAAASSRFPLVPKLWLDLAEVCRRRFDTKGERDALEQALRINPRFGAAVHQLAEIYERDQDFETSRQLLEQLLVHSPLDATNQGWYARILWRIGRKQEAIEHLKRAVQLNPGYQWAWTSLSEWGAQMDQPHLARDIADELSKQRPGEARSWLILARSQAATGEVETALKTLQHVTELNPRCTEAYDLCAEWLVRLNRPSEALAACNPPAFTDAPPLELRARSAWVHERRGQLPAAILLMEQVVRESPGFVWGWSLLADWYPRANRPDDYQRASERLVALAPFYAVGYGHRGATRLRLGDRNGARADWAHALQLDPAYVFGGLSLADLHLEDRELEIARKILQSLKQHAASDLVTAREVRLACLRCDRDAAQGLLVELCASSSGNQDSIRMASDAFAKAFGMRAATAVLREWFMRADANPEVVPLLIEAYTKRSAFWKCRRMLKSVTNTTEAWRRGAITYLKAILSHKKRHSVWSFVKRNWKALRTETWTWGYVAEALSQMKLRPQVLKWCSDWRERQGLTPRMLFFAAINARYRFRIEQAQEMHRCALALPPDGWEHLHRLTMLVDDFAARGLPSGACETFAQINPELLGDFYRDLWALAKNWIEIMSPPKLATQQYSAAATQLDRALGKQLRGFRRFGPFKRWRHQLLARLATSRGRPLLTAWHDFRATTARWI